MKLLFVLLVLLAGRSIAQPGLTGTYYAGTNFERKVLTRVDPQLNFNWAVESPAPGMPSSYYSIRWTGKILAPATGQYRFYAKVDDGIRIWVGNQKIMDSWQLNDSKDFTGSIVLEAGRYYDLRIDYFNDLLEGEIKLFWQRPDAKQTTPEPVTAQFFFRKAPPATPPKIPVKPVAKAPVVVVNLPKVALPKTAVPPTPKPVLARELPKKRIVKDSLNASAIPAPATTSEPPTNIEPDTMFNLRQRNIPFEQGSYILLPDAFPELDQLITVLKKHPLWNIRVAGYTDNVGDPQLNLTLSEYRAKVVANYLVKKGIANERITTAGYGGARPVNSNKTEGDRRENRRVVITRQ